MADPLAIATILAAGIAALPASMAAITTRRTHHAVQPNGQSLAELIHQQIKWDEYGHTRFHDILQNQAYMMGYLYLVAQQAGWKVPTVPVTILEEAAKEMGYRFVPYHRGDPDLPARPEPSPANDS